jgi:hypothetical protein
MMGQFECCDKYVNFITVFEIINYRTATREYEYETCYLNQNIVNL